MGEVDHRRRVLPLLPAILVVIAALLSGCGSATLTYVDPDYGFSFSYSDSWELAQTPASELPAHASMSVAVFDTRGSDAGNDLTFDYLSVDVYEPDSGPVPTPEEMMDGFEAYLEALRASDDSLRIVELPSTTVVGGQPALKVSYSYESGETKVRCSEYRLIDAKGLVYSLFTQASDANWQHDAETFSTFLDSFTISAGE